MASHTKDIGKYDMPKAYSGSLGDNGYPAKVSNTQTVKVRGTGAATKATRCSKKMG